MRGVLKIYLSFLILFVTLNANSLEDRAFNAYKNRDYKMAFKLYTKAAKSNSIKSFLMLGLFYEKGIEVKKDKTKAIKLYKYILKRTSSIKNIINDNKKLNIVIAALDRLYFLTNENKYKILSQKLTQIEKNLVENNEKLFGNTSSDIDDFLILCPHAKVVAPEDREGLEEFDCALFENFPKEMALFMRLRRLRFEALKSNSAKAKEIIRKIDIKIVQLIKPMIAYLQKEVVSCYSNAQSLNDIYSCNYDYLAKSDPLLFRNYSYKMEQYLSRHSFKNRELDDFEREYLVDKLVGKITRGEFGNNWEDMVKL